jgi:hypothetical protein
VHLLDFNERILILKMHGANIKIKKMICLVCSTANLSYLIKTECPEILSRECVDYVDLKNGNNIREIHRIFIENDRSNNNNYYYYC